MRLIDADEFCNEMKIRQDAAYRHSKGSNSSVFRFTEADLWDRVICGFVEAKLVMDSIPTVDAVPVVRCKDCEYWSDFVDEKAGVGKFKYCVLLNVSTYADFYCRLGERNGNDDNE